MKYVGLWWNGKYETIELYEIDGEIYALYGWNGEEYVSCWKCIDEYNADQNDDSEYCIRPIYKFQEENIDLDTLEENSDEWYDATEIVDFNVYR